MHVKPLSPQELVPGKEIDFPPFSLSEQEIIEFAKLLDPQKIHIDKAYAEASMFGGIIASGPHAYHVAHKKYWIELASETFLCGLSIDHWKFFAPIYPDMDIYSSYRITEVSPSEKGNTAAVKWALKFKDKEGKLLQSLDVSVLHRIK